MRLVVARCEVSYTGRLSAYLPESTRLLIFKDDGSVLVHADAGGYKPLNWLSGPPLFAKEANHHGRLGPPTAGAQRGTTSLD
jgi:RecB family endonuclease NucS